MPAERTSVLILAAVLCGGLSSGLAAEPVVAKPATITAAQWGSDPLPLSEDRRHTPRFITIHHAGVDWAADADPYVKIHNLQAWGKKPVADGGKDWPDLPYHFLISPDGRIFEGRPVGYEPETNTSYEVRGHVGVQLWGNFETQRIHPQQVEALVRLVAWLSREHRIDDTMIRGHRDVAAGTSCPGADFYRLLEDGRLLAWVRAVRDGESPVIELGPALPDGPTEWVPLPE